MHHVTARSVHGRLLFRDDTDHQSYLRLLAAEQRARRWTVFSWCHMPNHIHLLVRTRDANLGRGMKTVHERYATYVNERYEEHGHLFGDRFHNRLVRDDRHFVATLRYIARNPVAAGLCASASGWRWSAHRALAGLDAPPAFLAAPAALATLAGTATARQVAYAELVAGGDGELVRALTVDDGAGGGLISAVEDHGMSIDALAAVLGTSRATVHRRLAAERRRRQR